MFFLASHSPTCFYFPSWFNFFFALLFNHLQENSEETEQRRKEKSCERCCSSELLSSGFALTLQPHPSHHRISKKSSMAFHSRPRKRGDNQGARGSHFKSPARRFFKVINLYSLQLGKIAIPRMFIEKYGHDLSDKVFLKVPTGESFEVTLEEEEAKVWLSEGWRKFQDYYSLQEGSFIVFELKGSNVFDVLIFDVTATEIDYPVNDNQSSEYQPSETGETGDGSPAESSDASEPEPKRMRFRQQIRRLKKRRGRPSKQVNQDMTRGLAGMKPRIVKTPLPPSSHIALEEAKRYRPEFPAFRVRLRPSYMRSGGVSICSKFMKNNKLEPGESLVKLKHRGQSWPVKMLCYQHEHRGKLCSGWGAFLEDNRLCNGDVCIFELIRKNVFDVHFFRCSSYS